MYQKEITYNDYTIVFEYDYSHGEGLLLNSWTAYIGNNEIEIPCSVESEFIENQLNKWLDQEWMKNDFNYNEDFILSKGDRKYKTFMENV